MSHQSDLIAEDIHQYLKQHEEKDLLRFITCGSVDDGKSTLIGRLLHDTKMIYEDQLAAISRDSKTHGTTGEKIDLALLVDGLQSEREQGITIDVAYRYFSTDKRKFIIADTPGHEQYTRNMATGASNASLAILLIDARYGVQTQTRRHSFICSLLGIKHFIIAVNKMDLVNYSEETFSEIKAEYEKFAENLNVPDIRFTPISALDGVNVASVDKKLTSWYDGEALLEILETIQVAEDENITMSRFPVQYVNRPNLDFRGFCGTVAAGVFEPGQKIIALPSKKESVVKSIVTFDGEISEARPGDAVTLTLEDEIDISRGDMIVAEGNIPSISNSLVVDVVWMHENSLVIGKQYYVKIGTAEVNGIVTKISYQVDINTLEKLSADEVPINGIARCHLELTESVSVDPYSKSRHTGNLIFIDRLSNVTVGAGMVAQVLEAELKPSSKNNQKYFEKKSAVIWFTGLSGSGKTTTAKALQKKLEKNGYATVILDGDELREGLCSDLGFSDADRKENIRRVGEVAKIFCRSGVIAIVSTISPFRKEREKVKQNFLNDEFVEVYMNAPIEVCESRDSKGLYKLARKNNLADMTGIESLYEPPEEPMITGNSEKESENDISDKIISYMTLKRIID